MGTQVSGTGEKFDAGTADISDYRRVERGIGKRCDVSRLRGQRVGDTVPRAVGNDSHLDLGLIRTPVIAEDPSPNPSGIEHQGPDAALARVAAASSETVRVELR